ncbi:hypothetical protein OOZ15_00185 [Galbibacter sp. EGI 63066]|uniref:hypothetical protein n=1 Tax=Galbibacter sp. EGI 63066 TaxID=2993559 RepID=UPI0022494ABD|nr:hypothetical protein [Galbibacter sp. EGI 63066]MCX2678347.1 hypothetical protein [Galbibacter sp. EGI 63066]
MRFLLLSICVLVTACGTYPKKNNLVLQEGNSITKIDNPYFSNTTEDYVYKVNIDAFKKSFGGILILKKTGENQHRIVFTTEMGNKIFDFSFLGDEFKVNYVLEALDKKILLNVLKKDFYTLIKEELPITNTFLRNETRVFETKIYKAKHYYFLKAGELQQIVRTNKRKEKATFTFSEINNNIVNEIDILHHNIPLKINLKSI